MRTPIHTRDPFGVEAHLLVERAAQRVEHRPRSCRAILRAFGVDDQAAVVCADEPLDPDVTGFAIHLDLGNLRDHGLAAVGVRHATPRQDDFSVAWFRRDAAIPPVGIRGRANDRDRARSSEPAVVVGSVWTTFLPGFPDGSFGWAKVDRHLDDNGMVPKIHVEYVGQGDSDKPSKYPYGTMERADLLEALWKRREFGPHS